MGPTMAIVFEFSLVLGALTLGFVLGRIWEMRREIQRGLAARTVILPWQFRSLLKSKAAREQ
jgi:hypothetical protein